MAPLDYEWDERKRAANLAKHGIDFDAIQHFDWTHAGVVPDARRNYGEQRFRAYGTIGTLACVRAFTRRGPIYRGINLQRANARERRKHGF